MTDDEYRQRLSAFHGVEAGPPELGPDTVNEAMIRHWCEAIGDRNPVYTDAEAAGSSVHGRVVAPPTMLNAWVMAPGPGGRVRDSDDPYEQLTALLAERGFTSVVAVNCDQTYERYLRPGDRVTMRTVIDNISDEKTTALGVGHFVTTRQDYFDADDKLVGSMGFRILRFRPPAKAGAPDGAAEADAGQNAQRPSRPRPSTTADNLWWFEALQRGELQAQRCDGCGAVRLPPGPMCPTCKSLTWSPIEAGPTGRVHSFVRVHHPQVPSFDYPLGILLVDVDVPSTGDVVRIVMNPVDDDADATIDVGMPVEVVVRAVDDDLSLPFAMLTDADATAGTRAGGGGR